MNRRALLVAVLFLLTSPVWPATPKSDGARKPAPSSIWVGAASARPAQTATVPIVLRDRVGTPLGTERPPGERVQALSLRIVALPAEAVKSLSVRRAGATWGLEPLFESRPSAANGAALLVSFDEQRAPLPLVTNVRQSGLLVAEVVIELASTAKPGTRVELRLDPAVTALANQRGTIGETPVNGWLELHDGALRVTR